MRRRQFIAGLGAAAWPLAVRAQQSGPMRRIGVLSGTREDPVQQSLMAAFQQGLAKLGWTDGHNVRIDYRWGDGDTERIRASAAELVALHPDVLFVATTLALAALRQATRSIPLVFIQVGDPIGGGFVASLARPGGNITGFLVEEALLAGKWVQLLQKMAPGLRRAAYLFDPVIAPNAGQFFFRYAEAAAAPLMVEMIATAVRNDSELEEALAALAREPSSGLVVGPDTFTVAPDHRERIITLAAQYRLPAIYFTRFFATDGGLMSYGIDYPDLFRQAAGYVDRILRGEKPADLPVQAPTKYELVINLKTARAMGLDIPADMLSIANEVIE
jgi:putative tryptophan/tyrosine transport system substrate-binding protein